MKEIEIEEVDLFEDLSPFQKLCADIAAWVQIIWHRIWK